MNTQDKPAWLKELEKSYKKVELVGNPIQIENTKDNVAKFMELTGFDCIQNVRIDNKKMFISNIIAIGSIRNNGYGNAWIFEEVERQGLDPQVARDIIGFNFNMGVNWGGLSITPIGNGVLAK